MRDGRVTVWEFLETTYVFVQGDISYEPREDPVNSRYALIRIS